MPRLGKRVIGAFLVASGCVPPAPPEPPRPPAPPPPKILVEEDLRPLERPELVILDVQERPASEPDMVEVTGTILNRGNGRAAGLRVTVHVLDEHGNELAALPAEVEQDTLEANATVRFLLRMPRHPQARRYEVVAVAR